MTNELAYPDGMYQYIYRMCFLHSINIGASVYYNHKIGSVMGLMLFATSINYWRNPCMTSKRRTIDIITANICVPYHIYLSFYTQNKLLCSGLLLTGSSMYPISIWFNKYKYYKFFTSRYIRPLEGYKIATFCHCLLHLFVILGSSFIYRDYYLYN